MVTTVRILSGSGKSRDYSDVNIFRKIRRSQNVFCPLNRKAHARFQMVSLLRVFFEKLRFRDGLLWRVGLTVVIKLRCQISPT